MKKNGGMFTGKKKLGAIIACVVIVATLGMVTVFAANDGVSSFFGPSPESLGVKNVNVAISNDAVGGEAMHIVKNGVNLYSMDAGVTWSNTIPDGFTLDNKGFLQKIK